MEPDPRLIESFLDVARVEGLSGRERAVADHVARRLADLGYEPELEPAPAGGECGNLVCRVGGGGERVLSAHLDTARSTAGVVPRMHDDRITSDGTTVLGVDNRVGVALLLHLLEAVAHSDADAQPFTAVFMVREETDLAGSLNLELDPAWREAFVLDSSLRPGHVIHSSYGAKSFQVIVHGKPAHAGIAPERGVDAIRCAAEAISALPLGRIDATTTANVGLISGGVSVNTVPDRVDLEGEVRAREERRIETLIDDARASFELAVRRFDARLDFATRWDFRPFDVPEDSETFERARHAVEGAGLEIVPACSPGGSDANSLNARGLPALNFGIGAQNPHANDEFILLEDLAAAYEIAKGLVR
jgi:tripeptide aminopeptidase